MIAVDKILSDLSEAQADLRAIDKRRVELLAIRDGLIVQALGAGATWAKVQETTGLGPRGVALAVKRESA